MNVFDRIYSNKMWGKQSGPGSYRKNSRPFIDFVTEFLKTNEIDSILDLGCGYGSFIRDISIGNRDYLGVDYSTLAISYCKKTYPDFNFLKASYKDFEIPSVDLIVVKDVFHHLPDREVIEFISILIDSNIPNIILVFDLAEKALPDIVLGGYRPLQPLPVGPIHFFDTLKTYKIESTIMSCTKGLFVKQKKIKRLYSVNSTSNS